MRVDDVTLIARWDEDPAVLAALGGRAMDWWDWAVEVDRDLAWRELMIAEEAGRAIGFVQLTDAHEEESQYWGAVEPGTWTIDIWIGAPGDRGRGLGAQLMTTVVERCFNVHGASQILIDPMVTNRRAIAFYERLAFEPVGERDFDGDRCLVMRLVRGSTSS